MFLLLLNIFSIVLALEPTINFALPISTIVKNDTYSANLDLSNLTVGSTYYVKAYSVSTSTAIDTKNDTNWLSNTSSWSLFPFYVATSTTGSFETFFRANISGVIGDLKIRIREGSTNHDSNTQMTLIVSEPTPTSTPTLVPTPSPTVTPTPSATPTPFPNIKLNEIYAQGNTEWIEIYNGNNFSVSLKSWKFKDDTTTNSNNLNITLPANSYGVFEYTGGIYNDSGGDTVKLINSNGEQVEILAYTTLGQTDQSWSRVDSNWCLTTITKGSTNASCPPQSISQSPTNTITSSPTKTPTLTPTLTLAPTELPVETAQPTEPPVASNYAVQALQSDVLGDKTSATFETNESDEIVETKGNLLPVILIISGGIVLLAPLVLSLFKKNVS